MEASDPLTTEDKAEAAELLGLPTDAERAPKVAKTPSDLKARAIHRGVYLPSGSIVDIKIPNLALLIKSGVLPNDLVESALKTQQVNEVTREMIEENWKYTLFIIPRMLVNIEPALTEQDVEELDPLDIELLSNIAARRTDTDAIGRQLGGLDTQAAFREFREVESLREALGGF
jgi:hypothetical protein